MEVMNNITRSDFQSSDSIRCPHCRSMFMSNMFHLYVYSGTPSQKRATCPQCKKMFDIMVIKTYFSPPLEDGEENSDD